MKRTPLKRYTPLKSRTRINPITKKQAAQKRHDDKLRDILLERCQGKCMRCGQWPDWRGLSLSHTDPKGMGGTSHRYTIDEVQLLCGRCHAEMHGEREV